MIISFTGAQSTGKSTLLNNCMEEFGDKFVYFPEITRQIKAECGVAINEAGDSITQNIITAEHIKNMLKASKCDTILDRCILDGLVYTMYLHFDKKQVDEFSLAFAIKTFNEFIDKVDVIFYTDPKDVPLVDDGERSVNGEFRKKIIEIFEWVIDEYKVKNIVKLSGTVEQRMDTIRKTLKNKGINL